MEIADTVSAPEEAELTFVFALQSGVECIADGTKVTLKNGGVTVEGTFEYPVEVIEGKQFLNFVKVPSKKLVMKLKAKQCDVKTIFQIKE